MPEIIIVKKTTKQKNRNWKLKHLEKNQPIDLDETGEPLYKGVGKVKEKGKSTKKAVKQKKS